MTTENHNHHDDEVSALTGLWFDRSGHDEKTGPSSVTKAGSLDARQRRHAANLQLVHSLLTQLADRDQDAKERQIQQLMQRIAHEGKGQIAGISSMTRWLRPLVRYGIAALILLGFVVFMTRTSTVTANEVMEKMISAMDLATDRTYTIRIQGGRHDPRPPREEGIGFRPGPGGDRPPERRQGDRRPGQDPSRLDFGADRRRAPRRPPPERKPARNRGPGERAVLDGSTLYLRGSDQFVLFRPTPSGKTLINGCDGQSRWMIRPEKPVLISSDRNAFPIPMPQALAAILSLDFKATLQHISSHYHVKVLDDAARDEPRDRTKIYLDAVKKNPHSAGPQNIELWSKAKTGLLLRIEFAGIRMEDYPMPVRVIIELGDQSPLAEDWFTRHTHHSPDAEIRDITGQRSELIE